MIKEQEQKEEVNGKTDQSNRKKVPVLTISLRPGKELRFIYVSVCWHPYIYCAQGNIKLAPCFSNSSSAGDPEFCSAKARILIIKWQGIVIQAKTR